MSNAFFEKGKALFLFSVGGIMLSWVLNACFKRSMRLYRMRNTPQPTSALPNYDHSSDAGDGQPWH